MFKLSRLPKYQPGSHLLRALSNSPAVTQDADSETESLADLSLSTKLSTINVVLFSETGVGKSAVINLIAQNEVAEVSSNTEGCVMQSTRYIIPFDGLNFSIIDTVGLEEPEYRVNGYLKAIEEAYELIMKLNAAGGVHLLLFCMRGGRITATTQSNYRLFVEYLCSMKVPIALVFTGLEREAEMEDWWRRNRNHIEHYGIKSDGHAYITAVRDDTPGEDLKFTESQTKIRELLKDCALKNDAFMLETESWFAKLGKGMRSFIAKHRSPRKKDVLKVLTQRCRLDPDTAKRIAEIMERGDPETKDVVDDLIASVREQDDTDIAPGDPETKDRQDGEGSYGGGAIPEVSNNKLAEGCEVSSSRKIAELEKTIGALRNQITAADAKEHSLVHCNTSLSQKIVELEKTIGALRNQTATAERAADAKEHSFLQIIHAHENIHECESLYIHGCIYDAVKLLIEITNGMSEDLRNNKFLVKRLAEFSDRCVSRLQMMGDEASTMEKHDEALSAYSTVLSLTSSPSNTVVMGWARLALIRCSADESLGAATKFMLPKFHVYRAICDVLEKEDRVPEAVECFRRIQNELSEIVSAPKERKEWEIDFRRRCTERLERLGDAAMDTIQGLSRVRITGDEAQSAQKYEETLSTYSALLSLIPSPSNTIVMGWARLALVRYSVDRSLAIAAKFMLPKLHVYRGICDVLEVDDHVLEAISYFRQMEKELSEEMFDTKEQAEWEIDFRRRCGEKLENIGDAAMDSRKDDEAIIYYSNALSLNPTNRRIIVICCRARTDFLEDELVNATKDIELNPSRYEGYKRKHAVLHSMGRYREAFEAFEIMLSKLEQSLDPEIRNLRGRYLDTTPLIREVIEYTIRDIPRVLIDVTTGRLNDKGLQAAAFEQLPVFNELRSSMITRDRLDYPRIRSEVEAFYRYVMFSHKWQLGEPTYQMVENTSIYGLPASPTTSKLVCFCLVVRSQHFRWAWVDTCCVNQADKGVQQESVVAMFRWYRGSSLTIVHLLGVFSKSQKIGCLWKSIWNTRGWTYQEYVASNVVQFYTEDWKPYLDLEMFNHKESSVVLSEMQQATKIAPLHLDILHPGLDRVREKLYLASKRQTTREEDIAYSLFGIFNIAIPVIYGEGKQAVGRLLEHILTRSDNVTILAWTGVPGSHHSYLPSDLTVYDQIFPPHVPPPIETTEMDIEITTFRSSLGDLTLPTKLYKRLYELPHLSLVSGRLKLSGLVFPLTDVVRVSEQERGVTSSAPVYRSTTPVLGNVLIQTTENLSRLEGLVLIHPWISPLIDQDFSGSTPRLDLAVRALRLVVRLRQPFGALLLWSFKREQYKRVATDSLIMVQIREETTLSGLMDTVGTVDIQ